MSIVVTSLWSVTPLPTSVTTLYESAGTTQIKRAVFTNIDTVARTFSVHVVDAGDSASNGNLIIQAFSLAPGQSYVASELGNLVLTRQMTIQALASTANIINTIGSGFTL